MFQNSFKQFRSVLILQIKLDEVWGSFRQIMFILLHLLLLQLRINFIDVLGCNPAFLLALDLSSDCILLHSHCRRL